MRTSKYSEEQVIGFLKQAEAGVPVKDLCRKGGFSDAAFYKWRAKPQWAPRPFVTAATSGGLRNVD